MWLRTAAVVLLYVIVKGQMNPNSFVPYKVVVQNISECTGAGRGKRDAVHVVLNWTSTPVDKLTFTTHVSRRVGPVQIRSKTWYTSGGKTKLVIEYRMKNLCEHFIWSFLKPMLAGYDDSCHIIKGVHSIVVTDYNKLVHLFFGDKFIQGRYRVTTDMLTSSDHLFCLLSIFDIQALKL